MAKRPHRITALGLLLPVLTASLLSACDQPIGDVAGCALPTCGNDLSAQQSLVTNDAYTWTKLPFTDIP